MPGADSSRGRLVYRQETAWNETPPANAATTRLRFTGESLSHRNATVISEEIRPDRQRDDLILVGYDVAGDINLELSYGNFDWLFEAAIWSSGWATNQIINGTTKRSFNFQKSFMDIAKHVSYRGCRINSLDVAVIARRPVTMVAGIVGSKGYPSATDITGTTTPTEPNGNAIIAAGTNIKLFDSGGGNIDLNDVAAREVRFQINNAARIRELATNPETDDFGFGAMEVTGNLLVYFADITHYTEFVANAIFALQFTATDPADNTKSYRFTFPRIKVTDASPNLTGVDADVTLPFTFRAMADVTVGYTIKIERAVTVP